MNLMDEEVVDSVKTKNKKIKKVIIISIIILLVLCVFIVGLITYRIYNPTQITTYIDGAKISGFDSILDIQTDENGETQFYIPIRDFATYLNMANEDFGYKTYKGDYNPKSEDDKKCHVIREDYEVAIFTEKSKVIYKLNLSKSNEEYSECNIDKDIFSSNGALYASVDGIEKGYNVKFTYDEKKKIIKIYTLDSLIEAHEKKISNNEFGEYGQMKIDDNYENWKAIFNDRLIVKGEDGEYGIIQASNYNNVILEPQYDYIRYIASSTDCYVESNGKIGLFTKDGKRKIDMVYDELSLMSEESKLYLMETNDQYGVVDEHGNIIIYPEYEKIGTDVSDYSYNGIKNGYILLNELIPVMQEDDKWGFFDKTGKMITDGFIYDKIGCNKANRNNVYSVLQIPDYNVIIVGDENGKYSFMNTKGEDTMLPFVFENIYLKISSGNVTYWMTYDGKEYEVLKYLKQAKEN